MCRAPRIRLHRNRQRADLPPAPEIPRTFDYRSCAVPARRISLPPPASYPSIESETVRSSGLQAARLEKQLRSSAHFDSPVPAPSLRVDEPPAQSPHSAPPPKPPPAKTKGTSARTSP